jgi:DNA modification methylase
MGKKNRANPWNHFAIFPESLVEPCILAGSDEGDVILDPFCGSGTGWCCLHELNRKFIGIELNSEYTKLANDRIREIRKNARITDY